MIGKQLFETVVFFFALLIPISTGSTFFFGEKAPDQHTNTHTRMPTHENVSIVCFPIVD